MKILVLAKHCPVTDAVIMPDSADPSRVRTDGLKFEIGPYDEYGLEEALRIKDARPDTVVHVITVGSEKAADTLRNALARGADEGILVKIPESPAPDALTTANLLAAAARKDSYALIFAGQRAVDDDQGLVGPMLAELLDLPQAAYVTKAELAADASSITVTKDIDGGTMKLQMPLPALLTAQKGLNDPRYPSLKGLMASKKKVLIEYTPADLGVVPTTPRLKITAYAAPPKRSGGKVLTGEPTETAAQLAKLLREEAKII